jgi:hypothetical protein
MKLLALIFAFASLCLAADISGKWKADYTTDGGTARTTTFEFKVDGANFTGKIISASGDAAIKDGKIKGDEITFTVIRNFNGDHVKINYKGKVSDDSIQFNVQFGDRDGFEITAKRITT